MNSTKRKFNALLNGMGNQSTTSLAGDPNSPDSTNGEADAQAKKRRIAVANPSNFRQSIVARDPKMPIFNIHKKAASLAAGVPIESVKYAPWDRTEFLKRLKSFANVTDWTPKPARVNEVEWAKRGWVNQGRERVRCSYCNMEILVKLNRKEVDGKEELVLNEERIADALADRYVDLIITSHDEDCLWRARGCDDTIFKLPLAQATTALQALRGRYDELCARSQNLPYLFNLRTPPNFDLDLVLSYLPDNYFRSAAPKAPSTSAVPSEDINKVAFILALFGWEGCHRSGDQPKLVSCHACFRTLGLWLFKSKEINDTGEEVKGATVNGLKVVPEHREYCPWQNPMSQNGIKTSDDSSTGALAGWKMILQTLKNDHHLRGAEKPATRPPSTQGLSEGDSLLQGDLDDVKAATARDEEDKQRWLRLRRVKSMFDNKGKKLRRLSKFGQKDGK